MTTTTTLSAAEFDNLYEHMAVGLRQISDDFRASIQQMLFRNAAKIAKCRPFQLKKLKKLLQQYSAGDFRIADVIQKTYLYGKGKMARHLVENTGIKSVVFEQLPSHARRVLNTGSVAIKHRNQIRQVQAKDLTPAQTRRVISAHHPERGILLPHQQNASRFKAPEYYRLVEYAVDESNGDLVCRFVLNESTFMARVTKDQVHGMAKALFVTKGAKTKRSRRTG